MKTKPNFTYKEFIQKISTLTIPNSNKPQTKSPKALKTQNKNIHNFTGLQNDKPFQKRSLKREQSASNNPTPKHSPRKPHAKENAIEPVTKNVQKPLTSIKSTTNNKKLKLKNQPNAISESMKQSTTKHSKSIHSQSRGNFYHNQSSFGQQKHNESCSTFFRNCNFENEEDNFHNRSVSLKKSPSQSSKMMNKKHSVNNINEKLKIGPKGNLTDRNGQRSNTQYYEQIRRPQQRISTQYQKGITNQERMSPSFYKLSVQESSFLELQQDKTHKNLFPQSCRSRTKKSIISLQSTSQPEQRIKLNQKSYEHIYNKFISKISETLFQITRIQNRSQLLEHKIKYIEYLECLKELKMIRGDYEPYSQVDGVDLVKELWEELVMGQNINHFIVIVGLVLKITPLKEMKNQNSLDVQNYLYIQNKYEQFRYTRLELDKSRIYSETDSLQYHNFPFKPTIGKPSEEPISHSRSQKKYKINTSVNHNASLTHNASLNHNESLQLNSRRENTSINTEFEFSNNQSMTDRSPLGNKRSEILYKEGKKKSLQKRENKSTVDYEYEKNKQELTFKPKITIKRKKPKIQQSAEYISPRFALNQEKAINRLIRGRVQKQIKQLTIDKGLPYNDKIIEKLRKEKYQQIIREQQESSLKNCQNESKNKLMTSQIHNRSRDGHSVSQMYKEDSHQRCPTQVEHLESIHNLSFREEQYADGQKVGSEETITNRVQSSPLRASKFSRKNQELFQEQPQQPQNASDEFFALDIYFQENRSDKLIIRRDSTFEEIVQEAQKFVLKHNLPNEMGNKLKQELMIAMKFHDVQKIEENAEEDECSLLG